MVKFRMLSLGVTLCATTLFPLSVRALAEQPPADQATADSERAAPTGPTIAVADFSGQDKELGRFLADTLLTDLAQSDRLHLVERSEIRQALTELKLQSTGLVEPQQLKKVGKMIGADRLIVGSYLIRDNLLILNARLLDVHTGKVASGDAANVMGKRDAMLPLVHRLAQQFHKRMTGADLALSFDQADQDSAPHAADTPDAVAPEIHDSAPTHPPQEPEPAPPADNSSTPGVDPAGFTYGPPNAPLTEQDLATLTRRLAGPFSAHVFVAQHPSAPVARIRALAALVKVLAPMPMPVAYRPMPNSRLTPDADALPLWGRLYVASAIDHGLWPPQRTINPTAPATWAFVHLIISRAPQRKSVIVAVAQPHRDTPRHPVQAEDGDDAERDNGFTGIVIDARDMPVQRAMSVRVLDEDGRVLYPDLDHLPDMDYLQDFGMASYHYDGRNLERAGRKPLIVRALRVSGDDFIVSNDVADRILAENRRSKFLWTWHVCIIQDPAQ